VTAEQRIDQVARQVGAIYDPSPIREALADAWDEGYGQGRDDEYENLPLKDSTPNPYRTAP
jgi:hypothetical protein